MSREHTAAGMSRGYLHKRSEACFLMLGFFLETICPCLTIFLLGRHCFPRVAFAIFWVDRKLCV